MTKRRIVVTGLGVVAPNGANRIEFEAALRAGRSGITFRPEAAQKGLVSQIAGVPAVDESRLQAITVPPLRRGMNRVMEIASLAAIECWEDAGLPFTPGSDAAADERTGVVFGTGVGGADTLCSTVGPMVDARSSRQLGTKRVEQTMASGPAACVAGLVGAGGPVRATSAACSTGSACIVQALLLLRAGYVDRVVAGAVEAPSVYLWAMFDAMRILVRNANDRPEQGIRPLSASATGFVAAGGAGALMLETLESAKSRGARIYAELAGGFENCGGMRAGGSMTRQSPEGVIRCVLAALKDARVDPSEVDYINGHLTATGGDPAEIRDVSIALGRCGEHFPLVNATKSMTGHTLGAAGAIESVATVLQLYRGFVHPSINCDDLHPSVTCIRDRVPQVQLFRQIQVALKTSFGFGDVNACLVFRAWHE